MKKKWWKIVIPFMVLGMLVGCNHTNSEETMQTEAGEETVEIGMSFDTFVVERWQRDRDIFVSTANELGASVNVQNANGDIQEQIAQLEYFIDKKVKVIVVVPIDADGLTEVIERAKREGIKVICYDRLAYDANADLYISFDNEVVGSLMADYLGRELTVGDKIIMVSGPQTDANVLSLNHGFQETIEKSGIVVEEIAYMEDWDAEKAYQYINDNMDMIEENIKGIMCGNDNLASKVIFALAENRLAGKILVTGQDADLDACQRIVEGTQSMTVYKDVGSLAEKAAIAAVKLANGEEIEYEKTIHDGTFEIPYICLSPESVTSENMQEVIIDRGFHMKEDVYRNMSVNENEE